MSNSATPISAYNQPSPQANARRMQGRCPNVDANSDQTRAVPRANSGICICGHRMVEAAEGMLHWLDEQGNRTGDAIAIYGDKQVAIIRCRCCGRSNVWAAKTSLPNDIYGAKRVANGHNARLRTNQCNIPP